MLYVYVQGLYGCRGGLAGALRWRERACVAGFPASYGGSADIDLQPRVEDARGQYPSHPDSRGVVASVGLKMIVILTARAAARRWSGVDHLVHFTTYMYGIRAPGPACASGLVG